MDGFMLGWDGNKILRKIKNGRHILVIWDIKRK